MTASSPMGFSVFNRVFKHLWGTAPRLFQMISHASHIYGGFLFKFTCSKMLTNKYTSEKNDRLTHFRRHFNVRRKSPVTKSDFQGIHSDSVYFLKTLFLYLCLMYLIMNDQTGDLKNNDC